MYICVCRAISENRIRAEVAQGARHLRDLQRSCGLGTGCGKCVPAARECLHAALTTVQIVPTGISQALPTQLGGNQPA